MIPSLPELDTITHLAEKTIPSGTIRVPIAWIVVIVMGLLSLGIGYGGYRAGFQSQSATIVTLQQDNKDFHNDINNLRYDMGRLRQAVEDLKEAFDRKR